MVPRLGAATVLALIVVGQMLGSLTLDRFGILGIPQHSVSLARLIGAAATDPLQRLQGTSNTIQNDVWKFDLTLIARH